MLRFSPAAAIRRVSTDGFGNIQGLCKGPSHSDFDEHILVDQFGYRPKDTKVAIIRSPQVGYDAVDKINPGGTYQIRRVGDGTVVYSGKPVPWRHGEVEASSGDNGWWFDFSAVEAPGRYTVFDTDRHTSSAAFVIDQQVYKNVLKAVTRMFLLPNAAETPKVRPFADACWVDDAAYLGPKPGHAGA